MVRHICYSSDARLIIYLFAFTVGNFLGQWELCGPCYLVDVYGVRVKRVIIDVLSKQILRHYFQISTCLTGCFYNVYILVNAKHSVES